MTNPDKHTQFPGLTAYRSSKSSFQRSREELKSVILHPHSSSTAQKELTQARHQKTY